MAFDEINVPFIDFTKQELEEDDDIDDYFIVGKLQNLRLGKELPDEKYDPEGDGEGSVGKQEDNREEENKKDSNNSKAEGNNNKAQQVLRERNVKNEENIRKRRGQSPLSNTVKYISLAEGVDRYPIHLTKREPFGGYQKKKGKDCNVTVPQSPMLLTKMRHRPVDYPTAEEREEQLVQEIQSYKWKANPVNEKVFKTPKLGTRVLPKQPTIVQPFMLTEFKKKDPVPKDPKPYVFKASKIPDGVLEHPVGIPDKEVIPCTQTQTPSFLKNEKYKKQIRVLEEVDGKDVYIAKDLFSIGVWKNESHRPATTEVKPFSFEERDKQLMKQKEEKLKKIVEEEKKAREFHAKPLPAFIKSKVNSTCSSPNLSKVSNSSIKSVDDHENFQFKARPADVIHKKPFIPKKPEMKPVEPLPIELQTEVRAKERKKFDEEVKKELERREQFLRERREMEAKREEEEIARLRKEAVHRAAKIRHYKPVPDVPKKPLTEAESPMLSSKKTV